MSRSNPGIHSIQIGDVTVTALNDGQFQADYGTVAGLGQAETETLLRDSFRFAPPRISVSCFLIEAAGRRIIVDFGAGGKFGALLGYAMSRLADLEIEPNSIDTILLTHAHVDHIGGLMDDGGAPIFDNAELVVNAAEVAFWSDDAIRGGAPDDAKGYFDLARTAFSAYAGRTRHISDKQAVLPGITAHHLPGHTPGHTGYIIESAGQSLFIWADTVHLPGIQFARPDAGVTFDTDAEQARATRRRVFDMTANDRVMVAGIHHDFPLFGHVRRSGDAYAFEPVVWTPSATGLMA